MGVLLVGGNILLVIGLYLGEFVVMGVLNVFYLLGMVILVFFLFKEWFSVL